MPVWLPLCAAVVLTGLIAGGSGATAAVQPRAAAAANLGAEPSPGAGWTEAPGYLALVTPRLHRADYTVYRSAAPLADVLRTMAGDATLLRPPGAWEPRATGPWDAFGAAAEYNRWKIAILYGATRAAVARGPRAPDGRVTEAWTLVSPYPDPGLRRLIDGTLLIVLHLRDE